MAVEEATVVMAEATEEAAEEVVTGRLVGARAEAVGTGRLAGARAEAVGKVLRTQHHTHVPNYAPLIEKRTPSKHHLGVTLVSS